MAYTAAPNPGVRTERETDWGGLIVTMVIWMWVHGLILAGHWITWTVEQSVIILGHEWSIWAWPALALAHAGLLLLPLVPLALFWRGSRYRAVFQVWALAAAYILLMLPVRFAGQNQSNVAALLQIAGGLAYLVLIGGLIWFRRRRGGAGLLRPTGPYAPALLVGALSTWAWFVWGALGSISDLLLNLAAALIFGLGAGLTIGHFWLDSLERTGGVTGWNAVLGGLVTSTALLIMVSALGFNDIQLLMMFSVPALGWAAVSLCRWGREQIARGWLALAILLALAAAAPMQFVDPDELIWILNQGTRDIGAWARIATAVSVIGGWLLALLLWLFLRRLSGWKNRLWPAAGAAMAWLVVILLYFLAGQPGFHGDRLFVIWREQADVSAAAGMDDYAARRAYVYDTLVAHANDTQAEVRTVLDRLGVDYTPYYLVNAIEVRGGPLLELWLNSRPEVDRVLHSPVLRPLPAAVPQSRGVEPAPADPQWNLRDLGLVQVWEELGVTGAGIVIGQSDSGIQWDHPELRDSYRGLDGNHDYDWFDPWNHTPAPVDIGGHGTHTLGTVVGNSVGVAPDATWYGCANLARGLGTPPLYLDCMQFMLAPFPLDGDPLADGGPAFGAHVINNSWGCPDVEGCDPGSLRHAVSSLRAAGVFVVASAGNEGEQCGSVNSPIALYDEAFSVGAVNQDGQIASFSSRGPVTVDGSSRTKPDIMAPGVGVLSSYPGGTYESASGTSMAGPHVAGIVALMWAANPDLIGDIDRTEQILIETARPYDYDQHGYPNCAEGGAVPNNAVGYGIVDAYAAVQAALQAP